MVLGSTNFLTLIAVLFLIYWTDIHISALRRRGGAKDRSSSSSSSSTTTANERKLPVDADTAEAIRTKVHNMNEGGRINDVLEYLTELERRYGTLNLDNKLPSMYNYRGVALYAALQLDAAEVALNTSVQLFPNDTRSWINLGEIQVQTFKLDHAIYSFGQALKAGDYSALPRIMRTKGWSASWQNFEFHGASLEVEVRNCVQNFSKCRVDSSGGLEYTDAPGASQTALQALTPHSMDSPFQVQRSEVAPLWRHADGAVSAAVADERRLKVGLISADFGVHPVASLIRGLIQIISEEYDDRIELFCFALKPKVSWWGLNVSEHVEHFVWLQNMNTFDAALEIAHRGVEIIIDLNGHTMHSGLDILSHRPAPLQWSYLGLPTSTSAPFIDYYLADAVTLPPELRNHFSEQLVLLRQCYIVNDYAQVQGDVLKFTSPTLRAPREAINATDTDAVKRAKMLFATLSNSQKMDPEIFHVWGNILRRFSGASMLFMDYAGHSFYMPNLRRYGAYFGVSMDRMISVKQTPWIDHLYAKTAIDLVLDTRAKNGHTTGLDGIWAGVPTISLGAGATTPARAAEAIASTLEMDLGMAYSLKEYEDMAFSVVKTARAMKAAESADIEVDLLAAMRQQIEQQRSVSKLFDTRMYTQNFVRSLEGTWELLNLASSSSEFTREASDKDSKSRSRSSRGVFHLIATDSDVVDTGPTELATGQMLLPDTILYDANMHLRRLQQHNFFANDSSNRSSIDAEFAALLERRIQSNYYYSLTDEEQAQALQRDLEQSDNNSTSRSGQGHETKSRVKKKKRAKKDQDYSKNEEYIAGNADTQQKEAARSEDPYADSKNFPPIPDYVFDGRVIMLNIGGLFASGNREYRGKDDGTQHTWLTVNAQLSGYNMKGSATDIVRYMHDLHGFPNDSVSAIYCSHTLEHNSFGDGLVFRTLAEWQRVLRPGGILLLSVPDMYTLARLYVDRSMSLQERWMVTKMIFGSQFDDFDYHKVGFDEDFMRVFLTDAGFCNIERVGNFNLPFRDSSSMLFRGKHISLNMVARICPPTSAGGGRGNRRKQSQGYDGFNIDHSADPYVSDFEDELNA